MNDQDRKNNLLATLQRFIAQRPGLEFGNYGDVSTYRSEMRSITRDRHQAETLLGAVSWRNISADQIIAASRSSFSGRLTITETEPGKFRIDYCTGQYFPTEYRRAVCAVLASALWEHMRESMPAPHAHYVESYGMWKGNQFTHETSPIMGIHEACQYLEAKGGRQYGSIMPLYSMGGKRNLSAGDWLRANARKEFGRTIANRWFN